MSNSFLPDGVAISRDFANYGYDVDFWSKRLEVDAGPPESKINDLPFELDAQRSKIYLHKTANL